MEPGSTRTSFLIGLRDALQIKHTVLRNFPIIGHGRYLIESVRPELQQYLIESNLDAYPSRARVRALVYQRAKGQLETRPFGTQRDVYRVGYEWASHSLAPVEQLDQEPRVVFGGPDCSMPYSASHLNISAMSFGALSNRAVLALNEGAKFGSFAHNTGEGGTGAAPLEFSNSVGMPGRDGLVFVANALTGAGLRDKVRVIYSGKVFSAFHMIRAIALGADTCNSARGMMFALGCIQALHGATPTAARRALPPRSRRW
ncbi:MAG: glutamate synthase-related protein [Woeseiaceae bacterium]|nr:glutamate synthase-related protein [Woeseiaceae bacterium]